MEGRRGVRALMGIIEWESGLTPVLIVKSEESSPHLSADAITFQLASHRQHFYGEISRISTLPGEEYILRCIHS